MSRIVLFISGKGTNARNIIHYFKADKKVKIVAVFSTQTNVEMRELCENQNIDYKEVIEKSISSVNYLSFCTDKKADFIILAGFLKMIPLALIKEYPHRIINLHPSLLPKFGGKGMYGMHVHLAVIEAKETVSGITIHYVNEAFDEGEHIAQFSTPLSPDETPASLAAKIHSLEMKHFPVVIEELLKKKN